MDNSKPNPGNANLRIGAQRSAAAPITHHQPAIMENGVPGWHSRGYLPHFESPEATQHVTFHLADSLPKSVLLRLESELKTLPEEKRDAERRKRIDAWIDAGHGSCILRNPKIAEMVQQSLLSFDAQRYRLLAWVVMPNHVHALLEPLNGWTIAKVVGSWKKFTASKIYDHHQRTGEGPSSPIWHREYWDRYIRNQKHFEQAIEYIHQNPVKAGLVTTPAIWPWSSAFPGNANLRIGARRNAATPRGDRKNAIMENGVPGKP
ncbi:MAG TPA: transposase [Candidatus Acidoferrum sp.]|nr:transposase [Candidatus Acidoferrum sp.]